MRKSDLKTAWKRLACLLAFICLLTAFLPGCSGQEDRSHLAETPEVRSAVSDMLHYQSSMDLSYAECFAVDRFEEGSCLITTVDDRRYLFLPEGQEAPKDLSEDVTVFRAPLTNGYLAGTACMDFFVSCGALDTLGFSSLKADAWKIPEAAAAVKAGKVVFAGKYSAPDYELLTSEDCGFAVENTMIYHSPAVLEELESLGIPVLIDDSSREATPEGRMEWVRLYGLLTGHEAEAETAFRAQEKEFRDLEGVETGDTSPKVAFFSVLANGTVSVRLGTDYIPAMIERAGGSYIFSDLKADDGSTRSTQTVSMEEFYRRAKDADYFVWNSTIEGTRTSVDQLLNDAPILKDCKAVQNGQVYCTTEDFYQHTMGQGTFVRDLHEMLTGGKDFTYLTELD